MANGRAGTVQGSHMRKALRAAAMGFWPVSHELPDAVCYELEMYVIWIGKSVYDTVCKRLAATACSVISTQSPSHS